MAWGIQSGEAMATDAPMRGPAAAWVKQPALPSKMGPKGEAAIQLLLQDEQLNFTPNGTEFFLETATRIQTPQGLTALGTLSLPWKPSTDTLTIHKLHIIRDGEVIDVLARQSFTVLRREQNLEYAALDGVLTAALQPEDLRVGDILNLAYTLKRNDPVLKGAVDWTLTALADLPTGHLSLRALWPRRQPSHWKASEALTGAKESRDGETVELTLAQDDTQPLIQPAGAPTRFVQRREIQISDFASWAAVSSLMHPLFVRAATLTEQSPLKVEVARLRALSPDPKVQAAAALTLVQDQIRYVFLGLNDGTLVPATADETWSRQFGDCKAKTAMLLALLHELGITANAVLVNTVDGDGMDVRLPALQHFNHVLVRATVDGKDYWLDGTRTGDRTLDRLPIPSFHWGLPLAEKGATLIPIMPGPLDRPSVSTTVRIDASAGIRPPAPMHVESVFTGIAAIGLKQQLANLMPADLQRGLKEYWRKQYDFVDVTSVSATYDDAAETETLTMDGMARMDWEYNRYEIDGVGMGYKADLKRSPGPHDDAPYAVAFPTYTRNVETILVPNDGGGFRVSDGANVDRTIGATQYRRKATLAGGTLTVEATRRSIAPEFPAKDAPEVQQALREINNSTVYVYMPRDYGATSKDIEFLLGQQLTTADEYINRGYSLMGAKKYKEAIADFNKAEALDPKTATAIADRGLAHYWLGELDQAEQDFDKASGVDPRNAYVFQGRGLIAWRHGQLKDAVAAFSTSLEIDAGNEFTLKQRAQVYAQMKDYDHALADLDAVLHKRPDWLDGYGYRAQLFGITGTPEKALPEARRVIDANPNTAAAYLVAGNIYNQLNHKDDAFRALTRSLEIQSTPAAYTLRASIRPATDPAARQADLDAALKLDPRYAAAHQMQGRLAMDAGDWETAVTAYTAASDINPKDPNALLQRGIAYAKQDKNDLAAKDFAAARALVTNPMVLNNMCWAKAEANVDLEGALADCDAALVQKQADDPTSAALDSRGFVLLRLRRYDEAIASYDGALKLRPDSAMSLFGRGIAHLHKGETVAGTADINQAKAKDAEVATQYAKYGIQP
ncbi:tetratricopeptide repeat protein [Nitrospirillum sp. BR 11163]|uniref:tetratricopeptide repeat protein n=1 Tax=Nitrospirillum sp. BR 11163 TaxID=3104323 RepID=UPI002AFFAE52|nr:tetratricopeptide repeat protein [Nitrospirillum sp. BR 11163]MEA1673557.1 tetratricopeptide repeat protein [Nitrospirillum sp. BR 11163]